MDDQQFVKRLNQVAAENNFQLPEIGESPPSGETVAAWAGFLQLCVKRDIKLSDPRWERITISREKPVTVFELPGASQQRKDDDFKVGLQLLMGMLDNDSNP
jgi:hypothetical protein